MVLEVHTRKYIEERVRAGVLEQGTVELLTEMGVGERLKREGLVHHGVEFRFNGQGHHIDFQALVGRSITIYAQQEVVKDLVAARLASGAQIVFEAEDVSVHELTSKSPKIRYRKDGVEHELVCDFIAGCDGFHGVCRASIEKSLTMYERTYPFAWLGILAQAPPSSEELIYANHELGFALLSMRSPEISRLYIQCDPDEDIANWPDARIWEQLHLSFRHARWRMEAHRRAGDPEEHRRNAQFRGGSDAIRPAVSGGRRGAHRPAHGREGVEPRCDGCACSRAGSRGLLCVRQART